MEDVAAYVNKTDSEDDPDDWETYSSNSSNFSLTGGTSADEENYADDENENFEDVVMPNPYDRSSSTFVKDWIYGLNTIAEASEVNNPFEEAIEEGDYEGQLARGWPTLEGFAELPYQVVCVEPRLKKLREKRDWPNFDFPPPHHPNLKPRSKKVDFESQQLVQVRFEKWRELSLLGIELREALVMPKERELAKDPRLGRSMCEISPLRRSWTQVYEDY